MFIIQICVNFICKIPKIYCILYFFIYSLKKLFKSSVFYFCKQLAIFSNLNKLLFNLLKKSFIVKIQCRLPLFHGDFTVN